MATRLTTRKNSALSIDEYVNSIAGGTKYDDEVVETLFNLHDADCVICFEKVQRPSITPCKHIFCRKCILQQMKHHKECPCCRAKISEQTVTELSLEPARYIPVRRIIPNRDQFVIACEKGEIATVKYLIEYGKVTDVNTTGKRSNGWDGYTGLMMAARNEHLEIVRYLLSFPSIDVSICGGVGWNALHHACYGNKKSLDLIKLLLAHFTSTQYGRADYTINQTDDVGRTPLDKAQYNNKSELKEEIIQLLRDQGGLTRCELDRLVD